MQFLGLCVASLMGRFVPVQVGYAWGSAQHPTVIRRLRGEVVIQGRPQLYILIDADDDASSDLLTNMNEADTNLNCYSKSL